MTENSLFTIIPYKDRLIKLCKPTRARLIYKNKFVDLLSGKEIICDWSVWFHEYALSIDYFFKQPRVTHFFYELGFLLENQNEVGDSTILAIDIEYKDFVPAPILSPSQKIELDLIKTIDFKTYQKIFEQGRAHLLAGNCYQFNLTFEHLYSWKAYYTPQDFLASLWENSQTRGAFGSATYIPSMDMLYLSNSPECLFHLNGKILSSMPIKGTLPLTDLKDFKNAWKKLTNDKKNESELFMIIDLVRNDLSRIELPKATIARKKLPLVVPGLLHQYAKIEVALSEKVTIQKILEKIFPGGSITGAPKKSVMRILFDLEKRERKFYCGSTLICFKKMKAASINIRSAEIDFNKRHLSYQSGGGITLKSTPDVEFSEMLAKRESFIRAL